jgi:hypothetical protein
MINDSHLHINLSEKIRGTFECKTTSIEKQSRQT